MAEEQGGRVGLHLCHGLLCRLFLLQGLCLLCLFLYLLDGILSGHLLQFRLAGSAIPAKSDDN